MLKFVKDVRIVSFSVMALIGVPNAIHYASGIIKNGMNAGDHAVFVGAMGVFVLASFFKKKESI